MLAQRRVGEPEFAGEVGGGCRLDALQPLNDSSFGVGQLGHPENSTSYALISEALSCVINTEGNAEMALGFDKMFRS